MTDVKERASSATLAIELDLEAREALEAAAARLGLTPGDYIRRVLAQHLARERVTAAPRPELRQAAPHRRPGSRRYSGAAQTELDIGLLNMAYVRDLCAAFETGGVAAMAALVPPDVRWRPWQSGGNVLHGTDELAEFWASRQTHTPSLRMFHRRGDDVLVEAEYPQHHDLHTTLWLLFRFRGHRLIEAVSFHDEAEAFGYSPAAAVA